MDDKKALRSDMLKKRNALTYLEIKKRSVAIVEKLIKTQEYEEADIIFTYLSMGSEVSTYELINRVWQDGKKAAIPAVVQNTGNMRFCIIDSFDGLTKSRIGVMEPVGFDEVVPNKKESSVFIMPGLVFDSKKNRIGYGGGYYDRYLEKYPDVKKIGVCFSFQVIAGLLQADTHDIPVDILLTEVRNY